MSSEIVATIFRVLNFGVACGVGAYVFKKNLLPGIREKIAEQQQALKSMAQHNQDLLDQKNTIAREIVEQDEQGRRLCDQIRLWAVSFEKEMALCSQDRLALEQALEKRAHAQAEYNLKERIQRRVLETALVGVRQELAERFASDAEGKKMITRIIGHMREDMK
jgi:F0F1-type ATP synthase membrane subunit b/b'